MRFRKPLRWFGVAVGGLIGGVLGLTGAALGTEAGRNVVVSALLSYTDRALRGTLTIESFSGSLYRGLELRGVRIAGEDGTTLAEIPSVQARYRLRDLLSRRITLGQVSLIEPTVTLVEQPNGRLNIEEIFRLGEGDGDGGPGPLVAFRDVRIADGVVRIHSATGIETQRIEVADAQVAYLRLASPLPTDHGVEIDVRSLRATSDGLPLDVRGIRGRVNIVGDTVRFDLAELRLPNSVAAARGRLWDPAGDLGLDAVFDAERIVSADLQRLLPWLSVGIAGRGRFHVATPAEDVVSVRGTDLLLATANGGDLRGTLGFVVGPGDQWATDGLDVTTTDLDLAYLDGILDTIPLEGRLTGRTAANGPRDAVIADLDWTFRDARAPGATTRLAGAGLVEFGADDVYFHDFGVPNARIPLATVRGVVPAIALLGELELEGVLSGAWHNAEFRGTVRHHHGDTPPTVGDGRIRIDSRRDTVGVWADLAVDSLQFDGIRPSYPAAPFVGGLAGRLTVTGYLDSLALVADLAGPSGSIRGEGAAVLVAPHSGFRHVDAVLTDVRLAAAEARLPGTRVSGRLRGRFEVDTLRPPIVDLQFAMGKTVLGGARLDTGAVRVRSRESVLVVDSVWVRGEGLFVAGHGAVGIRESRGDSLRLAVDVDSAATVAPLLLTLAGRPATVNGDSVSGGLRGTVVVTGPLDRLAASGALHGRALRWHGTTAPFVAVEGTWSPDASPALALAVDADSIGWGERGFAAIEGRLRGRTDSLHWLTRARMGEDGAFLAGGSMRRTGPVAAVTIDSLAVLLADNIWFLDRGAAVTVTDSVYALSGVAATTVSGGSRIALVGAVPRRGAGGVEGRIEGLAVRDIRALLQLPVDRATGELSGTVRLAGTAQAPTMTASLQLQDFVMNDFHAPLANSRVQYAGRRLTGVVTLAQAGEQILNVEVDLPLDLALQAADRRLLPGDLEIRARADGVNLQFVNAINPRVRSAGGLLSSDFGVTGSWERPQLTGFLSVVDGAATFPGIGVRHEGINGRLRFAGDTIRVERLTTRAGGGLAQIQGYVRLVGLTEPELELDIRADRFRALDVRDFLTLTTSGAVHLEGPLFGAALTGSGTVTDGVVYFADIIEKDIINLEDTAFAVDPADAALIRQRGLGTAFQNRFLDSLRIDTLQLEMGGDVRLRSNEADIQLTGAVTVSKLGERYRIDGTLQTPRGTYQLPLGPTIRKEFTVTRGEVRYFGTPDLNAALDIDARHQLRDYRGDLVVVSVNVGGTINVPSVTLSSDVQPPLSQTEIISYMIFGAPSAQAVGGRAGQYGLQQTASTIAAQLSGQLGSALISDLGVPLDYFEVRPEFGGEGFALAGTEIALGRQIGDRWFLTLNPRICPEETFNVENLGGAIEFRMSRQWRLSASFDPLLSCFASAAQPSDARYQFGFDVLWEKRY